VLVEEKSDARFWGLLEWFLSKIEIWFSEVALGVKLKIYKILVFVSKIKEPFWLEKLIGFNYFWIG